MKTLFVCFAMAGALNAGTTGLFTVDARSNIFGADQLTSPEPGGIAIEPGLTPPGFMVPSTATMATFERVTGLTNCIRIVPSMGPDGGQCSGIDTQINSYGGISGIVAREHQLFLVGLFLGASNPTDPAPNRLSYLTPADYAKTSYSPELNQTFFIGDGLTGTGSGTVQTFFVPTGARRLYFGFEDTLAFGHFWPPGLDPGYFGDNVGALSGTFNFDGLDGIPTPLPILTPEPASFALVAAGLAFLLRRK